MLHDAHVSQHKMAEKKSYQTKADEFAESWSVMCQYYVYKLFTVVAVYW